LGKQQANLRLLSGFGEQLADCALEKWMDEQRIEFAQRHEDEPATVHARMRHYEIRFVDDPLAIEQDIQIDGSGTRSVLLIPPECVLDLPKNGQ
jgi:hypothetical protein